MRSEKFAHSANACLLRCKGASSVAERRALLRLAESWLHLADAASVPMFEGGARGMAMRDAPQNFRAPY